MATAHQTSSRVISRERLLGTLCAQPPRLLVLVAPAGYGKTSLAGGYLAAMEGAAICDALGAVDVGELAQRFLVALAGTTPGRADRYAAEVLALRTEPEAVVKLALDTWRREEAPGTMLLDNLERAGDVRGSADFFAALLDQPHRAWRLVLCSRTPLPFRTTSFAPPNEIVTLRAADLRFDAAEIAQAFEGTGAGPTLLGTVTEVTRGWPIAVLLLARFAREGRLGDVLGDLRDVAFGDLYDYLALEIVRGFGPGLLDAAILAAALPETTIGTVRETLGEKDLHALRDLPFVAVDGERIEVHPLVRAMLRERYAARARELIAAAAKRMIAGGDIARAARAYVAVGDVHAAAEALADVGPFLVEDVPVEIAEIINALDNASLRRYPNLWSASLTLRIYTLDRSAYLAESRAMWARYKNDPSIRLRLGIFNNHVTATALAGRIDEARVTVEEFAKSLTPVDLPFAQSLVRLWRIVTATYAGLPIDPEQATRETEPALQPDAAFGLFSYSALARHYRLHGDRHRENEQLLTAITAAERSRSLFTIAVCRCDAAFGAWFWGDDEGFQRHLSALEREVAPSIERGVAFFIACARGWGRTARPQLEDFKFRAFAYLLALSQENDPAFVAGFAQSGLEAADASSQPFVCVLARVAAAVVDPVARKHLLDEALTLARPMRSVALLAALGALKRGETHCGMLEAFVARFRARGANGEDCIDVRLLALEVRRGLRSIPVERRGLELLVALATANGPVAAQRLSELLWPDKMEATNALYVTVARLRAALGAAAIVKEREGYALGPAVRVDLPVVEARVRAIARTMPLAESERSELQSYAEALREPLARLEQLAGLESFRIRIERLARDIATMLGRDALERKDAPAALEYASGLLERDPCDEPACEIMLRSHLARGERGLAVRALREYSRALQTELNVEPSRHLLALLVEV